MNSATEPAGEIVPAGEPLAGAEVRLHALARSLTGLEDFGERDDLEGLRALLASCDEAGDALSPAGRRAAAGFAVTALAGRLESEAGWAAHPEAASRPLRAPLVVLGLPRTGTTALHRILCALDDFQGLELWLAQSPRPRPPPAEWSTHPAHRRCEAMIAAQHRSAPEMQAIHEMAPDDPDECWHLLRQSFASVTFECALPVPGYARWWQHCDMRPAYRRWARNLALIGLRDPDRRWVLKDPSHLFAPEALLETAPDATFVLTHRDPARSIPSVCSLNAIPRRSHECDFDPAQLGREQLELWARGVDRMLRARQREPDRFVDVHFRELRERPLAVVRRICERAGGALSAGAEAAVKTWLEAHPPEPHRYAASDFGLDPANIRRRFEPYIDAFEIPLED